jgi:hypothetical protein
MFPKVAEASTYVLPKVPKDFTISVAQGCQGMYSVSQGGQGKYSKSCPRWPRIIVLSMVARSCTVFPKVANASTVSLAQGGQGL